MNFALNTPEQIVGWTAILLLVGFGVAVAFRRMASAPLSPDPWDSDVARDLESGDATPLCHRCITEHGLNDKFCPRCGAPVGQYVNFMPYEYLFSVGHMFRLGTSGQVKRSFITTAGFLLVSCAEYIMFAPIYWIVFLLNLRREKQNTTRAGQRTPDT